MTESVSPASQTPADKPVSDEPLTDLLEQQQIMRQASVMGRLLLLSGITVSCLIFWWLANLFSIPNEPGFSVSLLQQPHCFISLFVLLVASTASMFVARVITRSLRPEAALFCVGLGLASISLRGGGMKETLFDAGGAGVFAALAFEATLLFAIVFVSIAMVDRLRLNEPKAAASGTTTGAASGVASGTATIDEQGLAVFAHAAAMAVVLLFLCRSDAKLQSMLSVAVAAAVGAFVARQVVTIKSLGWLWISPLIVAIFGYLVAWFRPDAMSIGVLYGPLASLARPMPLDFVGMGVAGTIVGYWMGNGEGDNEEDDEEDGEEV